MPVLRIDYDSKVTSDELISDFSTYILEKSTEIFGMKRELFSVFVRAYGPQDYSTAQIEVECLAGAHEFEGHKEDMREYRDRLSAEHGDAVRAWKVSKIDGAIIATVTVANWKVTWVD